MPTNSTIASPEYDLFSLHYFESNAQSQAILDKQRPRLTSNARIMLWCMLEGQHLTGYKINAGIKHSGMDQPKRMSEYRRRIGNIREFGIQVEEKTLADGCKEWWIDPKLIESYKIKCKDIPKQ